MSLTVGQSILQFTILDKIGSGGMGEVWLAKDTRLDREVAIKVMSAKGLGDDERRARFRKEALSLSKLNHPNIAIIHDFVSEGDLDLLVMEYVRGEGLDERVEQGPLSEEDVLQLGVELADGLEAAHAEGIVHRDLKPANLRIADSGHLKILDFGLAKAMMQPAAEDDATRTSTSPLQVVGTVPYMSPEQLRAQPIDERTDIFAAGAVLYEAATGKRAHPAETTAETIDAVLNREPVRPSVLTGAISRPLETVLLKALSKEPGERYQSAAEMRAALQKVATPQEAASSLFRRPWMIGAAALVVLALVTVIVMQSRSSSRVQWAREEALPQIAEVAENVSYADDGLINWPAFNLAVEASEILGKDDPALAAHWKTLTRARTIHSEPAGAEVFVRPFAGDDDAWISLGTTPIENVDLPLGVSRVRFQLDGHETHDDVLWIVRFTASEITRTLHPTGSVPEGMTWIRPFNLSIGLPGLEGLEAEQVDAFWADTHEVTNRQYKEFVDAGGYSDSSYWDASVHDKIATFVDRTGRPGPSIWEAGDYPDGDDDLPVGGVNWYEASAYAAWAGKQLPTIFHWNSMAFTYGGPVLIKPSNFQSEAATPVGTRDAIHVGGTRDLAGNVREWCRNATSREEERFILGGGWSDAPYAFNDAYGQPALDRSAINGFRCIQSATDNPEPEQLSRTIDLPFRDFFAETPVDDATYELILSQYAYDRTDLNATVDETVEEDDWTIERVSFDATYGGERVDAYLFLPKSSSPPYSTMVVFPGSGVIHRRDNMAGVRNAAPDWLIKSGRAVIVPIYNGTLERGGQLTTDQPTETVGYRDFVRMWAHDLSRTVDYLETRDDVDMDRLGYWGFSWGGRMSPIMLNVEPRIKTAILYVAGLKFQRALPEADPFNFITRVNIPVLMLNGRNDFFFPLETSQRPMYELMGTADEDKKWVVYDGGHSVPRVQLMKESLDWLDRYLEP